ncbi:MAG TPA: YitT family protein, partial [Bacillota bacterium]|nr:YitT family protein [Bacillota bacterium]
PAVVVRALLIDIIGSALYGVGIVIFAAPARFAPGGVAGIAVILNYLFKLPMGLLQIVINLPIIAISLRFLGWRYLLRTFVTLIINALFLDVIIPLLPLYEGSQLLAALFAGAFCGAGLALIYNNNSCTGGSDLVIMSLRTRRPHLSIGQISMLTDGALILAGAFVYKNIDAVLYGILFTIVSTTVIDRIMSGFASGKIVMIISARVEAISDVIAARVDRGSTLVKARGAYTKTDQEFIMCACSNKELPAVRQIVKECDGEALLFALEYKEAFGNGFDRTKHKRSKPLA